ncbi:DUF6233 domain-containing protein [Streptomyces murinus]|uniref:DUF6233 domain-containing protein n=1 Tax=Streptomyces murinus TaxID=33900 RepID=UPI003D67005E
MTSEMLTTFTETHTRLPPPKSELVNEKSSRLAALQFLEAVQVRDLARTRGWIAEEERRQAAERRAERTRPSVPVWLLDRGPHQTLPPITVHVGGCWAASPRAQEVGRDAARQALSDGVEGCSACRPDAKLDALG